MLSLSPAKILVILVIALLVLGPDKLPGVARQIGAAWHDLRKLRGRLETEVRDAFPDLPSPQQVAQAVRSPLSYLDTLADKHAAGATAEEAGSAPASGDHPGAGPPTDAAGEAAQSTGVEANGSANGAAGGTANGNGAAPGGAARPAATSPPARSGWADGLDELADDPSMN